MKHLQTYGIFESKQILTSEQKKFLDDASNWSQDPLTGLVNVDSFTGLIYSGLKNFKGVRFGEAKGNFICDLNHIETLEGAPQIVGGNFNCLGNNLTTLKGAPQTVGRSFNCEGNNLTTLEGAPRTVGGNFYCTDNPLETLAGAPETIGGQFYCTEFICQWNLEEKLKILTTGKPEARALIATALPPKHLQKWINKNPIRAAVDLKGIWKTLKSDPKYANLKFPEGHSEEADLLADLNDIGL
jgi:hypothetical protein